MAFVCKYSCGRTFTAKCSCQRHENNSCKRKPDIAEDLSPEVKSKGKIQIKLSNKVEVTQSSLPIPAQAPSLPVQVALAPVQAPSDAVLKELLVMNQNTSQALLLVMAQLKELREELHNKQTDKEPSNVSVNTVNNTANIVNNTANTVVYNYFGDGAIELFNILRQKHGGERAVNFSNKLLKGKTKETKHNWVTDSEVGLDLKSLSRVLSLSYESGERDPCFQILNKDQQIIKDRDGSSIDKILTHAVVNANLKAHNYIIRKARKARRRKQISRGIEVDDSSENDSEDESENEGESREGMWDHLSNASIYNPNNKETYHDDIARYEKIPHSKKHMIRVITDMKNLTN